MGSCRHCRTKVEEGKNETFLVVFRHRGKTRRITALTAHGTRNYELGICHGVLGITTADHRKDRRWVWRRWSHEKRGKNRQTREVSSLSSLLTKPRKFLLSHFAKQKSYNEQLNSEGWWLRFLWSVVIKGVWKDMNGEWAVTNAKKECEEVVTNTTGTSFRIGTPRFKKKKKKSNQGLYICFVQTLTHASREYTLRHGLGGLM